jgi:hypothetical protein
MGLRIIKMFCCCALLGIAYAGAAFAAVAQDHAATPSGNNVVAEAQLPDAPSVVHPDESTPDGGNGFAPQSMSTSLIPGPHLHRIIQPGQVATELSVGDKLKLSIASRFTLIEAGTTAISSGISQARDTRPHYGTDAPAFGERFGAAALKHTTSSFLSYGVFASALHQDPRYYVEGREHRLGNRIVYSATRLFIARTDGGGSTFNSAKMLGLAGSNGLTNLYYPEEDRGAKTFFKLMGTSLYGTVISNEIHEFSGDLKRLIFHRDR